MLAIGIHKLLSKSKVDHLYFVQIIFVSGEARGQTDKDIVQLDIVEGVSGLVDDLDLFEQL